MKSSGDCKSLHIVVVSVVSPSNRHHVAFVFVFS